MHYSTTLGTPTPELTFRALSFCFIGSSQSSAHSPRTIPRHPPPHTLVAPNPGKHAPSPLFLEVSPPNPGCPAPQASAHTSPSPYSGRLLRRCACTYLLEGSGLMPARFPPLGPLRVRVLVSRTAAPSCFGLREQVRAAAAWRTPASRPGGERAVPALPRAPPFWFPASPSPRSPCRIPRPLQLVCSGDGFGWAVSRQNLSAMLWLRVRSLGKCQLITSEPPLLPS